MLYKHVIRQIHNKSMTHYNNLPESTDFSLLHNLRVSFDAVTLIYFSAWGLSRSITRLRLFCMRVSIDFGSFLLFLFFIFYFLPSCVLSFLHCFI